MKKKKQTQIFQCCTPALSDAFTMTGYGSTYAPSMSNYNNADLLPHKGGLPAAFVRAQRRRMNLVAILLCILVPWGIFSVIYGVLSSTLHHQRPVVAYTVVMLGLVAVVTFLLFAIQAARQKQEGDPHRQPNWYMFLFVTSALAWISASVAGDINYYSRMRPFIDVQNLNAYSQVDTAVTRGQQLMDAGTVMFASGTKPDVHRSTGFRNQRTYCVAPIVTGNATHASYDFWAVGIDCCSGVKADFHCKDYNNPHASGGLRLMRDEDRAFYRLAVQQAEATYNIKAYHPLFFEWIRDPVAEVNSWQDGAFKAFLMGSSSYLLLQLFLVASVTVAFSKLGNH